MKTFSELQTDVTEAIEALFSCTDVDSSETKEALEELRDEIEMKIDSL